VFAADYDLEQKRKLTELQLKEHILQQQRAMIEASTAAAPASMEVQRACCRMRCLRNSSVFCAQDLGKDIVHDDTSAGGPAGQMSPLTAAAAGALFGTGEIVCTVLLLRRVSQRHCAFIYHRRPGERQLVTRSAYSSLSGLRPGRKGAGAVRSSRAAEEKCARARVGALVSGAWHCNACHGCAGRPGRLHEGTTQQQRHRATGEQRQHGPPHRSSSHKRDCSGNIG
jgi:hypothetical protein